MAEEATQTLAQFVSGLRYDDIPQRVREHCKNLLLDALACAVSGRLGEETGQVAAFASALAQSSEASVIGGESMSLAGATLLNAYLITATTMCDVHRETMTHVTPEVMPPALLIAERDGLNGRALLTAIAAGCEITTRVGIGTDYPKFRARGWHGPGIFGPFGSAAAVGSLLKFDAETMARAFGLAGSQAAGTFAAWGTPTVKFHQCRGALSGLMAALLAQQKFVATREFLTAKDGGLYNTYVDGGKADAAVADLGTRWELEQIGMRLWPSATLIQGMNTALFDLLSKHADRYREHAQGSRFAQSAGVRHAWRICHLQSQVRGAAFNALYGCGDPARPDADLGAVRAEALRRSEAAAVRGRAGRGPRRSVYLGLAGLGRDRYGGRLVAFRALRASPWRLR